MNILGFSSEMVGKPSAKNLFGFAGGNAAAKDDVQIHTAGTAANDVMNNQSPQIFQLLLGFLLPAPTKITAQNNSEPVQQNEISNTLSVHSNDGGNSPKQSPNILGVTEDQLQLLHLHGREQVHGVIGFSTFPQTGFLFNAGVQNKAATVTEVTPMKNTALGVTQDVVEPTQSAQLLPNNFLGNIAVRSAGSNNGGQEQTIGRNDAVVGNGIPNKEKANSNIFSIFSIFPLEQNPVLVHPTQANVKAAAEISLNTLQAAEPSLQQVLAPEFAAANKLFQSNQLSEKNIQSAKESGSNEAVQIISARAQRIPTPLLQKETEPANELYRAIIEASVQQSKTGVSEKKNNEPVKQSKENSASKVNSLPSQSVNSSSEPSRQKHGAEQETTSPHQTGKNIFAEAEAAPTHGAKNSFLNDSTSAKSSKMEPVENNNAAIAAKIESPDVVARQVKNETIPQPIISGTQHTAAVELPKEVQAHVPVQNREMVFEQILKDVSSITHTPNTLEIKLSPEHLGKVEIKIGLEDGKMNARIDVQNTDVKQIVESNIARMRETLHANGVTLDSINVFLSSDMAQQQQKQQEVGKKKFGYSATHLDEIAELSDVERETKTYGYNTVEYII